MNPIVVAELAGSASYGGGERYLELLCERLDPSRFRPILVCPEPGSFVGRMQVRGVDVRAVHLEPLLNPFALMRLVRVLSQENVTILQTHGARANFYGRVAGWVAEERRFRIALMRTIVPGFGSRGALAVVNAPKLRRLLGALRVGPAYDALRCRLGMGLHIVAFAQRR